MKRRRCWNVGDESFVLFLFLCEEEKRCSDESVFVEERCEFPRKREFVLVEEWDRVRELLC